MRISALLVIIILSSVFQLYAQSENVLVHDKLLINTNRKKGVKSFKEWGVFPSKGKDIRRITMNLTLAYPADRAIAHWDYMDRVKILRQGGLKGKDLDIEIGRMLTPYGSNFKEGWSYTWSIDVTDFQAFLRDSVEIEYLHSGYESPDLGWDLTIDFDVVFGPPVANFITMEKMWVGGFQYGNPDNHIEKSLAAKKIKTDSKASFGRFRILHTGHGMDDPSGCSEFCSRWREFKVDGKVVDHRDMWKDCGNNPLYPQGGTWIFDRAYWCPGDLQDPDLIDFPLDAKKITLDLDMEPFEANDLKQPKEQITSYFFQYEAPNKQNDVAIAEIIAPNKKENYNRFNPTGFTPIIKIQNLGAERLKSVEIHYRVNMGESKMFNWQGDLAFYEYALINIPTEINGNPGVNTFHIELKNPNNTNDEWTGDNQLSSEFYDIPTLPSDLVVDFMTNNMPEDNNLYIINSQYDTVFMRTAEMLKADTTYSDTLHLAEGNYALELTDSAGNGLEFWFMAKQGYGRLRLLDTQGNIIKLFESDNGNGVFYGFRVDNNAKVDTTKHYLSVNIYPRMIERYATLFTTINETSVLKIIITKDGEYIESHEYTNIKDAKTGLDLGHLENGRYVMQIFINGEHKMNRRFNKVDKIRY